MKKNSFQHEGSSPGCQKEVILKIAVLSDNEYYMSAIGPLGDSEAISQGRERAQRGMTRILINLEKLKSLQEDISCKVCEVELDHQIQSHLQAIREIKSVWKF